MFTSQFFLWTGKHNNFLRQLWVTFGIWRKMWGIGGASKKSGRGCWCRISLLLGEFGKLGIWTVSTFPPPHTHSPPSPPSPKSPSSPSLLHPYHPPLPMPPSPPSALPSITPFPQTPTTPSPITPSLLSPHTPHHPITPPLTLSITPPCIKYFPLLSPHSPQPPPWHSSQLCRHNHSTKAAGGFHGVYGTKTSPGSHSLVEGVERNCWKN